MLKIKGGHVIDPYSGLDAELDIVIDNEIIIGLGKDLQTDAEVIDAKGCVVTPGFIDVHSHFRDPGYIIKEDLMTGAAAAVRGGYTTVVCMANTMPVIDNIKALKYVLNKAKKLDITLLQTGSITKNMEGKELTDFYEMKLGGAVGFTDDGRALTDSNLVLNAMYLAKELDVPLSFHEEDPKLVYQSGINYGEIATLYGLKGARPEAEEVMVARDSVLAIKTGAKINIQHLSSALAVDLIRYAKSKNAKVTAEVTPHHFSMTETDVLTHRENAKMNPPLRTQRDLDELISGLKDGTIDIIASDHAPHSKTEKEGDFSNALSGIIGLETAFPLAITNLLKPRHMSLMEILKKFTVNPAKLYGIMGKGIKIGYKADLVIFDINKTYCFNSFHSRSANSPFLHQPLYGKILQTIKGEKSIYVSDLS